MFKSVSYKSKQLLALLIKLLIVIGFAYFLYFKLARNQQLTFSDFYQNSIKTNVFSLKNSILLLSFSFFNWFLEILKWKLLANQVQKTSFKKAAIQSLASLTVSLITPNRIGEYGAKALYFKKELSKKILALNFLGNFSQLLITIVFGFVGCTYLFFNFSIKVDAIKIIYILTFFILIFIALWFINKKEITFKGYSTKSFKVFMTDFPKKSIQKIISFSALRYLLFSHQFYFLLIFFNIEINYLDAIMCIFSMYLIASIIPMLTMFDVIIKSSVAIVIFSLFPIDETKILVIVLLMWIFNFVLPSIVGSYFVLTFKSKKLIKTNV